MPVPLGPTLETPRLILRPPVLADLDGFEAFGADPDAMRFLGGPGGRPVAWRALTGIAGSWALHGFGMFSVVEAASGRWIGRVGPWRPEGWPGPEVGWGLLGDAQGRGYAAEAAEAAIDWAFDRLGWEEVIHTIDPENAGSVALARRLGSANRGPGRLPAPYDHRHIDVWGQGAAEWRARRSVGRSDPDWPRR